MTERVRFQVLTDEMHDWLLDHRETIGAYSKCCWCAHDWHATKCPTCRCWDSRERPDDTWRPRLGYTNPDQVLTICHDTGIDGYAAQACVGIAVKPGTPSPVRLKNLLYGKTNIL